MKQIIQVSIIILLLGNFLFAQSKLSIGIGGNVAIPVGGLGDVASTGFGGGAIFAYGVNQQLAITGSGQYLKFGAKDDVVGVDWTIIPVLVGTRYYFSSNFYSFAEIGMNFWSTTVKIPAVVIGGVTVFPESEVSASDSDFGFAIGGGYELPVGTSGSVDISVKYQQYASSTNAINLAVAYKFKI